MDYQDAICTLNTLQTNASALEQVKRERGHPQLQLQAMRGFLQRAGLKVEELDRLNIIHVTGTKGKGSTCAFTEQILRNYGLRTGFYSSPHLVQVRERIRINGQPIGKELFTKYFWQVYCRLEETKDAHGGSMPAYFRFLTILAFHVFLQEKVDLAVIEVGIGGAYDCTNIIRRPWVCGISSLGIDHTSILGDTIEKIAWQKGGIFKPGVPAFTVKQPDGPMKVLQERAEETGCSLSVCPDLEEYESEGSLRSCIIISGRVQQCLAETEWPGRNQTLKHGPVMYFLDGAHTTRSMQACVRWFNDVTPQHERNAGGSVVRVLLFNATGERDCAAMLKLLVPCHFDFAVFCPNITEAIATCNADQQNFNVSVENMLTRCLDNQQSWRVLNGQAEKPEAELLIGGGLPLVAERHSDTLVFPCILSALQWISQGRDSVLPDRETAIMSKYYDGVEFPFCDEFSKYEKLAKIGQGTFGEVFKAKHRQTGKKVALKKVLMENEKEGFPITALREIKILQLLKHENVVNLIEICRTKATQFNRYKGSIYLVFDFCEHDLAGLLSNANVKFTLAEIKKVMQMLLNGLYYIHRNKILHRDMKAANVLITRDGVLKLADFGLARAFSLAKNSQGNRYTNRVVTLWYRPPELLLGERDYGPPIDLWGGGCIMAEMWTRSPIMQGNTEQHQLTLISQLCGSITPEVWPGVDKKYELYQKMELPKGQKRKVKDRLKAYVKDPYALDLIDKLLVLDPAQRIDSDDALNHDFFWSDPMPSDLKNMLSTHNTSMFEYLAPPRRRGHMPQQPANQNRNPATTSQPEFDRVF
ncbi:cyclin-dependent kinase 9 [Labeo rohita]|uniref:Folylpoly-gamma-glutamate synthetase n=1 Tax=Labeo rohita TaxID=84645 RepID=A0A498MPY8_LABRO|nr:cyclin-dependent kinase 9 [Labeo rohita]